MKKLCFYLFLFIPLFSQAQTPTLSVSCQKIRDTLLIFIPKMQMAPNKKTFYKVQNEMLDFLERYMDNDELWQFRTCFSFKDSLLNEFKEIDRPE